MTQERTETEENERREFLAKAASAVGAVAATGLVSALLAGRGEAAAVTAAPTAGRRVSLTGSPLVYQKLRDGHSFEITSTEITTVLAREGLLSQELAGKQATVKLQFLFAPSM